MSLPLPWAIRDCSVRRLCAGASMDAPAHSLRTEQSRIAHGSGKDIQGGCGTGDRSHPAANRQKGEILQAMCEVHAQCPPSPGGCIFIGRSLEQLWWLGIGRRKTHFLAIPFLATPAVALGIDDAGPRTAAALVVRHGQLQGCRATFAPNKNHYVTCAKSLHRQWKLRGEGAPEL